MSSTTENPLIETLVVLGSLYPQMRFGQLVAMVALIAGEESPLSPDEIPDDRFLDAMVDHIKTRREQLRAEAASRQGWTLPESRAELLKALQQAQIRRQDWRFGQLVEHLAATTGSGLYDAEDEELISAARGLTIDQPE